MFLCRHFASLPILLKSFTFPVSSREASSGFAVGCLFCVHVTMFPSVCCQGLQAHSVPRSGSHGMWGRYTLLHCNIWAEGVRTALGRQWQQGLARVATNTRVGCSGRVCCFKQWTSVPQNAVRHSNYCQTLKLLIQTSKLFLWTPKVLLQTIKLLPHLQTIATNPQTTTRPSNYCYRPSNYCYRPSNHYQTLKLVLHTIKLLPDPQSTATDRHTTTRPSNYCYRLSNYFDRPSNYTYRQSNYFYRRSNYC